MKPTPEQITRALFDPEYRATLPKEVQDVLPANPAGELQLSESTLDAVAGGAGDSEARTLDGTGTCALWTLGCCVGNDPEIG